MHHPVRLRGELLDYPAGRRKRHCRTGATTMQKWGIKLDFEAEQINYRKTAEKLRLV